MAENKEVVITKMELEAHVALHYDLSLHNRSFSITGDISEETYTFVDSRLNVLESQGRAKITIRINSCGGSVYDALAIVGRIQRSPCYIVTEGMGAIMSAATLILASGKKRRMHELATFMHHKGSLALEGTVEQIKEIIAQSEKENEVWCQAMAKFSTTPASYWLTNGNHTDLYLNASQCLALGVVDQIF